MPGMRAESEHSMHERKDRWSVGQWMTPNPDTVAPDLTVRQAFVRMRHEGYRHLLVVDGQGALVGIVTDRDLRRPDISDEPEGWHEYYNLDQDYEVSHVMTEKVVTLTPQDRLEKAIKLLMDNKFGAIPVLDKTGAVIGILTMHDVARAFGEALQDYGDVMRR